MRAKITTLVESTLFNRGILVIILLNTVVLGLETWPVAMDYCGDALRIANAVFITIYVIEALLKLFAQRLGYFRSGWNVFDFIIVLTSLVPTGGVFSGLRILRIFRILRAFRLISGFKPLRRIVSAITRSLPGVGWTVLLMLLVYYVFSIVGIHLFSPEFPERFGSLPAAFETLFELTTLEGWQDIVRPVSDVHGWAWVYFLAFIIIASFILLNIVLAIVVNSLDIARADEQEDSRRTMAADGIDQDEAIVLAMDELRQAMAKVEELVAARQGSSSTSGHDPKSAAHLQYVPARM